MNEVLCSTGALIGRPNNRDYTLLEKLVGDLDCDGLEFMVYSTWYDRLYDIADYLVKHGFRIPVVHCEKSIGELLSLHNNGNFENALARFEQNCILASRVGAESIVVHLWDGLTSDSCFDNNTDAYFYIREISEKYKLDLLIENVVCNVRDPLTRWNELVQTYPDIHFIFDTKMSAFHNQLKMIYGDFRCIWDSGLVKHYHINDYRGGYMDWQNLRTLPIGDGDIDFDTFFSFLHEQGYCGRYTVESTAFDKSGQVDTAVLNRCFGRIRSYITSK